MFTDYLQKAMKQARYEIVEDDESFFGAIPGFEGLWANGKTLEECRTELQSVLEEWLVLGLWLNDESIPVLGKMDLVPRKLARRNGAGVAVRARKAS